MSEIDELRNDRRHTEIFIANLRAYYARLDEAREELADLRNEIKELNRAINSLTRKFTADNDTPLFDGGDPVATLITAINEKREYCVNENGKPVFNLDDFDKINEKHQLGVPVTDAEFETLKEINNDLSVWLQGNKSPC